MKINRGREAGAASELRTATFTGEVWGDPVLPETDGVLINNVFFAPSARTHWHTHHQGQILVVTGGEAGLARATVAAARLPPGTWCGSRRARSTGTARPRTATCSTWPS